MKYEDRVVAFIDILGFKQLVSGTLSGNDLDNVDKIQDLIDAYDSINQILFPENFVDEFIDIPRRNRNVSIFSDAIAISFKVESDSEVFDTLDDIKLIIMSLVDHGILCRGGIVRGKLIHTDDYIFGPALVEAYTLESEVAVYPRVILDREIVDIGIKYKSDRNSHSQELDSISSLLEIDSDGFYYMDYFFKAAAEMYSPEDFPYYLNQLSSLIRSGLQASSHHSKANLRGKFYWMRERYNQMVDRVKAADIVEQFERDGEDELAYFYSTLKKISPNIKIFKV
jgi:hypothetical protein